MEYKDGSGKRTITNDLSFLTWLSIAQQKIGLVGKLKQALGFMETITVWGYEIAEKANQISTTIQRSCSGGITWEYCFWMFIEGKNYLGRRTREAKLSLPDFSEPEARIYGGDL